MTQHSLRLAAEEIFAHELTALAAGDARPRPPNWKLSPQAVVTYLMGGKAADGAEITAKYVGNRRLMETAVATLATDRALLLLGVPGTAKSLVSEHLAAAICGSSRRLVQCTAGTDENQVRYGWNYALLLAKGPSREAIVPTPIMRAMQDGAIVRLEEMTRMGSEVQDTLITILSEKTLPIPELDDAVDAARGFNVIATANNRDKGVNELSSALKRRFNVVVLPLPATPEEETGIVVKRVAEIGAGLQLPPIAPADREIARIVTLFRELRDGRDSQRQAEAEGGERHAVDRRGDFGRGQRLGRGRPFRRRRDRRRRARRQSGRRDHEGSRAGPDRAAGISGECDAPARRLGRSLQRDPRRDLTRWTRARISSASAITGRARPPASSPRSTRSIRRWC